MERFACFFGYDSRAAFASDLLGHLNVVQGHYAKLFEGDPTGTAKLPDVDYSAGPEDPRLLEHLAALGFNSKQSADHNATAIRRFKRFELRAIVNYGKLTTGFNHEGIDFIIMLRPTMSVGLWVQMLGRATRPCEGKENALVLDFARNTPRLGPINDPAIPNKKGNKTGDLPVKICEGCGVYNHISARKCDACGTPFEFQVKIVERAGTEELIKQPEALVIDYFDVNHVVYKKRQKAR